MKLEDIRFRPRPGLEEHPRYQEFRRLIGLRDFSAYREVFERGWAETSIICGELVRLDDLPITQEEPSSTPLVNLMGVNDHSPRRVRLAEEFFSEYERLGRGRFLRQCALKTGYVQDLFATTESYIAGQSVIRSLLAKWVRKRQIKQRIVRFLNVYDNMKRFGTLVGRADILHNAPPPLVPHDLPWAIDYCGYIKLRDGAHRRAIAHYLGWGSVPTLVFEYGRVTRENLDGAHPYIRDNFTWFAEIVRKAASLESRPSSMRRIEPVQGRDD